MKKVNKHILFVSVVFEKELGLLTISGPFIKGEVSLNDHDAMMNLEQSGFFDTSALAKPPEGLGEGYDITAHLNLDGELVPFIQMVYYPTAEGEASYVHYTGRLDGQALRTVDEWHILNQSADGVLRDLMTANNIAVQSALIKKAPEKAPEVVAPAQEPVSAPAAEPVTVPAASPEPPQPYLLPILVVGFLALTGLALVLRRRTVSHTA
jgi:hypothetical protein